MTWSGTLAPFCLSWNVPSANGSGLSARVGGGAAIVPGMIELGRRRSVSQSHLLELLTSQLDDLVAGEWRPLDIVDVGGGTGVVAIPLASRGHRVTVIDPSPDALASLERRAADSGVTDRIRALQGDAADLADLVPAHEADAVLCHRVLEVLDAPEVALRAMAGVSGLQYTPSIGSRSGGSGTTCSRTGSLTWAVACPYAEATRSPSLKAAVRDWATRATSM